jgi:Domain of unknown function (DUF4265)
MMGSPIKINFKLEPDDDGYPPVAVESLWANPVGNAFEIDSIPFFTSDATVGDVVYALADQNGAFWYDSMAKESNNSLIRLAFLKPEFTPNVAEKLRLFGCSTEGLQAYKMIAVNIPNDADIRVVQEYLELQSSAGLLDYEEAILRH